MTKEEKQRLALFIDKLETEVPTTPELKLALTIWKASIQNKIFWLVEEAERITFPSSPVTPTG